MNDEVYKGHARYRLPPSMTGGKAIYAGGLMMVPRFFINQVFDEGSLFIPCFAEPGDRGRIMHMPCWSLAERQTTNPDDARDLALMAAALDSLGKKPPNG